MKRCSKCGEEKTEGEFGSGVRARGPYVRSQCNECKRIEARCYYELNKEKKAEYGRRYRSLNKKKIADYGRQWYAGNRKRTSARMKEWYKKQDRFARSLISSDRHAREGGYSPCTATAEEIGTAFTGFCQNPGCRIPEVECKQRLCLDHNHGTGRFRGWLCHRCNRAAGLLNESKEIISGLAEYVNTEGLRANNLIG